ncbi:MAG: hypothetical protein PHH77_08050 [Victivallaceae bacterium]|nr:hypothetical protein [Victivallaceae bacterium]
MKLDSKAFDRAVATAVAAAENGRFSLDDVFSCLPDAIDPETVKLRLERELELNDALFKSPDENIYVVRSKFFTGRKFLITPGESEIDHNILFPGHRFCTFCREDIFPSEITVFGQNDGRELHLRQFTCPAAALMPSHIFLGSEQLFDFLVAENPANRALLGRKFPRCEAVLNVFDLEDFYRAHDFTLGDALLVTVKDWTEGVFVFSYLSGADRRSSKVKTWIDEFGRAVEMVIDRFGDYLEIPDQLRWAFFLGGEELWGAESGSLDEFYRDNDRIEVSFTNADHTVLVRKIAAPEAETVEIPDNIGISRGRTETLDELLTDIKSSLKAVEIDAYIFSCCYQNNPDFDLFFRRCFGIKKLSFADDAQEVVFMNYLEDRWETLFARYNPHADQPKAELRDRILESIDARLELLEYLEEMNVAPEQLPEAAMDKLAEVSLYFRRLLEVLNSENHTLLEEESEAIAETIAGMGEIQAEQIEKIHSYLGF